MECKNCGSATDPIVSECQYCGSPIKGVDLNSIPTEDVIRYANKWIGVMEELPSSGWMNDVGKEDTIFSQPKFIQKADINSNVKEYLGLLDVRSDKDALAKRKYSQLTKEYESAVHNWEVRSKLFNQKRKISVWLLVGFFCLFLLMMMFLGGAFDRESYSYVLQ